jgi:hypothetical protein
MLRIITAAGILAIASPALAQDAAPMDTPPQDTSASPGPESLPSPAPTSPAAEGAPPADAGTSTAAAPPPAEPSKEVQVKQVVEANFPTYDADQSGDLNAKEFDGWLTVLRQKSAEAKGASDTMPDAEKQAWMKAAFAKADTDQSKKISKAELETFLLG